MTPEEAKKLAVGDVVLVRGVVDDLGSQYPAGELLLNFENPGDGAQRTRIPRCAVHSVLPRPLAVGDRVKYNTNPQSTPGDLLCIWNDAAWVRWDSSRGEPYASTESLATLERVP